MKHHTVIVPFLLLPRKINRAAHYALSTATLAKVRQITTEHVQTALEEVQ